MLKTNSKKSSNILEGESDYLKFKKSVNNTRREKAHIELISIRCSPSFKEARKSCELGAIYVKLVNHGTQKLFELLTNRLNECLNDRGYQKPESR